NRSFERGRWYSTVSALTSRKLIFRKSHTRLMSRRAMWRTVISGCCGFFLLRARLGTTADPTVCSVVTVVLRGLRLRAIDPQQTALVDAGQDAGRKTTNQH